MESVEETCWTFQERAWNQRDAMDMSESSGSCSDRSQLDKLLGQGALDVLDAIYDGILIADADAVVLYVNPEYTRITGVRPEDIVGRKLESVRRGVTLPAVIRSGVRRAGVYRRDGAVEYVVDMAPIYVDGAIAGGVSVVKDITEIQTLTRELSSLRQRNNRLRRGLGKLHAARYSFTDIVTRSDVMRTVMDKARRMATSHADILILGESGTGKEVLAQSIHNASDRAGKPFLAINCAALSPEIMESELFGYADAAFTGAQRGGKEGLFEVADGGTLFLDEISEMSLGGQAKLLRVLQERTVRRVGGTDETPLDVRIIAATNRDLRRLAENKLFREDLYYRLNVLQLTLPPLREREGDIPVLAEAFACSLRRDNPPRFSPEALRALEGYSWPGNIRELRNTVEYALYLCEGETVEPAHLPPEIARAKEAVSAEDAQGTTALLRGATLEQALDRVERQLIGALLQRHGVSLEAKKRVADELGIALSTLYAKIEKHGLADTQDYCRGERHPRGRRPGQKNKARQNG